MGKYSYTVSLRKRKVEKAIKKVRTFHLKHQNTILLLISFIFTYYLVKTGMIQTVVEFLGNFGYLSAFILGFLFSFGFTTTPASTTLFFLAKYIDPLGMAFIAAIGSAISNLIIYLFVKNELLDEIRYILSEELRLEFSKFEIRLTHQMLKKKWLRFFVPALAGILTAMPIPTELVAAILWNIARYKPQIVLLYSFIFSFIGIFILGLFGISL
ncbi:MAG: hypothetical protein QW818_02910 [Candidatus Aenigmatarchaeota archaeon]|nr:hypothetical protein [Candidatus Aenigmarchaeota archaeon]